MGLAGLAGCLPERRADDLRAPPEHGEATAGGTGPLIGVEPSPPAPPLRPVPRPGPVDAPPPSAMPRPDPPRTAREPVVQPPRAIVRPAPRYPAELQREGIEGRAVVHFVVDIEGRVRDVQIQASHPPIAQAVREVLPRWRFEPARGAAGQAVPAPVRQVFRFKVED